MKRSGCWFCNKSALTPKLCCFKLHLVYLKHSEHLLVQHNTVHRRMLHFGHRIKTQSFFIVASSRPWILRVHQTKQIYIKLKSNVRDELQYLYICSVEHNISFVVGVTKYARFYNVFHQIFKFEKKIKFFLHIFFSSRYLIRCTLHTDVILWINVSAEILFFLAPSLCFLLMSSISNWDEWWIMKRFSNQISFFEKVSYNCTFFLWRPKCY